VGLAAIFYAAGALSLLWLPWFLLTYKGEGKPGDSGEEHYPLDHAATVPQHLGRMLGNFGYLYVYFVFASWLPGYLVLQRKNVRLEGRLCGYASLPGWRGGHSCRGLYQRLAGEEGARVTVARKVLACSGLCMATVFTYWEPIPSPRGRQSLFLRWR